MVGTESCTSILDGVIGNSLKRTGFQICLASSILMKSSSSPLRCMIYFISSAWLAGRYNSTNFLSLRVSMPKLIMEIIEEVGGIFDKIASGWLAGRIILLSGMDILSSMLSIVKSVSDTDREFKILREKLLFHIQKAEATLKRTIRDQHCHSFIREHLQNRLKQAKQKLTSLETLLSSSNQQTISFKDKLKLSLPFNNERDRINACIEDLKQAIEEVLNNNLPVDPASALKKKPTVTSPEQGEPPGSEIDELYQMGPTIQQNNGLDFAQEYTKNHTVELKVELGGKQEVLKVIQPANRISVIEKSCQRLSRQQNLEIYKLGRLNFRTEYKFIKPLYPDIDKISKLSHFRILWKRALPKQPLAENKKTNEPQSQKKEEGEQFFSVQAEHTEIDNGRVMVEKEQKVLYRRVGGGWVKIEEDVLELVNGEELAISLNKDQVPDLFFKVTYRWK